MKRTPYTTPYIKEIYDAYCEVAPEDRHKARFIVPKTIVTAILESSRSVDRPLGDLTILGRPVTIDNTATGVTCVVDP